MADKYKYAHKTDTDLDFQAGITRIRTEGRIVLNRVLNEAINQYSMEFRDAIKRGESPTVVFTPAEVKALVLASAQAELAARTAGGVTALLPAFPGQEETKA